MASKNMLGTLLLGLQVACCQGFTLFNPSDAAYYVRLQEHTKKDLATLVMEPHSHYKLPVALNYPSLNVTYHALARPALPKFRLPTITDIVSFFDIGQTPWFVKMPVTVQLKPASYERTPTITGNFNGMFVKTKPVLIGPRLAKPLAQKAVTLRAQLLKTRAKGA